MHEQFVTKAFNSPFTILQHLLLLQAKHEEIEREKSKQAIG